MNNKLMVTIEINSPHKYSVGNVRRVLKKAFRNEDILVTEGGPTPHAPEAAMPPECPFCGGKIVDGFCESFSA